MPKKKKKREKGGDGMTLAQRIEAMKKEKEEAALKQTSTVEEPAPEPAPAPEEVTKKEEEPPVEIVNDVNQQSQEEPKTQRPEDCANQREIPDTNLRREFIPAEFGKSIESFNIQPKDGNSHMNFDFGYLPPAMFLPEQSYISRRAYQMFSKYHDYIDNIDKLLDHTLSNIINNNSHSPAEKADITTDNQDMPPDDAKIRALLRYLLSDPMQMEMDRFLADV